MLLVVLCCFNSRGLFTAGSETEHRLHEKSVEQEAQRGTEPETPYRRWCELICSETPMNENTTAFV